MMRHISVHYALALTVMVLLTSSCSSAEPTVLTRGDEEVRVTYGTYELKNVNGYTDPIIRAAGYECSKRVKAAEVRIVGIVDHPGTIIEQPTAAQYMKVMCEDGGPYQVATCAGTSDLGAALVQGVD